MNEHDVLTLLFITVGFMLGYLIPERFLPRQWYPLAVFAWVVLFLVIYAAIPEPWFRIDLWAAVLVLAALLAVLLLSLQWYHRRSALLVGDANPLSMTARRKPVGARILVTLITWLALILFVLALQHVIVPTIDWVLDLIAGPEYVSGQ